MLTGQAVADLMAIPFTAEQLAAITAPATGAVQVVAGAGSGKTAVMAARVVWLVGSGLAARDEVLGLTFTTKAAGELAGRVRAALDLLGSAEDDLEPTVVTYHAYAGSLVREHGLRIGVEPDARLLADAVRFQLAGSVLRRYAGPLPYLSNALSPTVAALVSLEAELSDHLCELADARAWLLDEAATVDAAAAELALLPKTKTRVRGLRDCAANLRRNADLCLLAAAYRTAKRERGAVDFGDQIVLAERIANRCPEVAAAERSRYRVVLLDEYQDTSVAQRELLRGLYGDGAGLTAVGDPCQAIYGWRGASVANLVGFPGHFGGAAERRLQTSMRSGGRLLSLANRVAEPLRAAHPVASLVARAGQEDVGRVVVTRQETFADELAWVARQVRGQLEAGTPPGQVAVLLRRWANVGAVHAALTGAGIPVEVVGLGGLIALPEVADVIAVLTLLDDQTANASLLRLLAGPRWRLGRRDLQEVGRRARHALHGDASLDGVVEDVDPLEEAASGVDPCDLVALADVLDDPGPRVSDEAGRRLRALGRELRELRRHTGEPLPDLVARVLTVTGLDVEVGASDAAVGARRRESLSAFHDVVASYADLDGESTLHAFLAYLRAADDFERGFDSALPTESDAVQLMTVHKAKGLEWDVVVLPDLTKGTFPADRATRWPTTFGALPYPLRSDRESLPAPPTWQDQDGLEQFVARCAAALRLEEDRLAYVATTRARHTVIASSAVWGPTQLNPREPSPYLLLLREHAEAGNGVVDGWAPGVAKGERNPGLEPRLYDWPVGEPGARLVAAAAAVADPPAVQAHPRFAALDAEAAALLDEAREARVSTIDVPLPTSLSASQVLVLSRDPDGLARSIARPMPARPIAAARRGTAFHAWVEERFDVMPLLEADELPGSSDASSNDSADLAELQAAFLATEWADRVPATVEAPFAVLLGGRLVRGRIDAVYQEGDGWLVVDWKTGRERADPLQLAIYRTAWAAHAGVSDDAVDAAFLTVRTGQLERPVLPSRTDLDLLLA